PSDQATTLRSAEFDVVEHWINPNRDSARVGTVSVRLRKLVLRDCSVTRTKYGFSCIRRRCQWWIATALSSRTGRAGGDTTRPSRRSRRLLPMPSQTQCWRSFGSAVLKCSRRKEAAALSATIVRLDDFRAERREKSSRSHRLIPNLIPPPRPSGSAP